MQDLGTLGGDNATAVWLNNAGEVVGAADLPGSEVQHAFLWRNGVMTDLGTLGSTSRAKAINSKGQVVGFSFLLDRTEPPFRHAFLWEKGGPMIDLNTLIPANSSLELVEANTINDRGEIVGIGVPDHCFVDFCGRVYILIPCAANDTQGCEDNPESTTQARNTPVRVSTSSPQFVEIPNHMETAGRTPLAEHIPGRARPKD